ERISLASGFFQVGGQQRPHILPLLLVKWQWFHAFRLRHRQKNRNPYFNAYNPPRALPCSVAPVPRPLPTHPSGRSGRTTRKTGTSVPAWPFGPASVSVEKPSL